MKLTAIIAAAGSGTRLGGTMPKQFLELDGSPVMAWSIEAFAKSAVTSEIVIVTLPEYMELARRIAGGISSEKPISIVEGGATRQESVENGIKACSEDTEWIAVHDAARPFIETDEIEGAALLAIEIGAAIMAEPIFDTIKEVDNSLVVRTVDRSRLFRAQTPQICRIADLATAYEEAAKRGVRVTDEASLLETAGFPVAIYESSSRNFKITTETDLLIARALIRNPAKEERFMNVPSVTNMHVPVRIGSGYDVHRLVNGRKLILGGIEIPFEQGLDGHSDADVLLHAICDALLGASGLGDIGMHFPDTDSVYKNISSMKLLETVISKINETGYVAGNIDATVVAQAPKLSPFIERIRENIAKVCKLETGQVNVKATTTEGMGFTGTGHGMAAYAVAVIFYSQ